MKNPKSQKQCHNEEGLSPENAIETAERIRKLADAIGCYTKMPLFSSLNSIPVVAWYSVRIR